MNEKQIMYQITSKITIYDLAKLMYKYAWYKLHNIRVLLSILKYWIVRQMYIRIQIDPIDLMVLRSLFRLGSRSPLSDLTIGTYS